jgi:spore maturation protein SpmB
MYCSKCFSETLKVRSSGVVKLIINDKQRDNSLFTFNTQKELKIQMLKNLRGKIADFIGWYSEFQNVSAIEKFELYTADLYCASGCVGSMDSHFTVIGVLFTPQEVQKILNEEAAKFNIEVKVNVASF